MRLSICLCLLTLAACAAPPDRVAPGPVDRAAYHGLDCPALIARHGTLGARIADLSRAQTKAARADAAAVAMGLLLFPPALAGLVATPDHAADLALAKGRHGAVGDRLAALGCAND